MSVAVPVALAAAGTAFAALAFFGPSRKNVPFVPVLSVAHASPDECIAAAFIAPPWPTLVEATAIACDARARIDLVNALGSLHSPWSGSILRAAYATEPDTSVRAAITAALMMTVV